MIPVSGLGFLFWSLLLWRFERSISPEVLRLAYLPLRASYLLILLAALTHVVLWICREKDEGWLWALWCSLLYAAIIITMVLGRLSGTIYGQG